MGEFTVSTQAYCKMVLHALKYPHCSVNGVLLAERKKGAANNVLHIVDAVPLFHRWLSLTPALEIALSQIDLYCQTQNRSLVIAGYYQANERHKDNNPDSVSYKVAEKLHSLFNDAVLVVIDNTRINVDDDNPCYRVFCMQEQKWKPKDGQKFLMENDEQASLVLSNCIQQKVYREITDFENHLDDIGLDFWNTFVNDKIKSLCC